MALTEQIHLLNATLINVFIVAVVVVIHNEALLRLSGLVLITWSASFLFVEMQRYWPTR